jgi:UDP-N-acetylglucosamine acyltransferase
VGPKVTVGPRTILRNHVVIESHTRLGADNVLYPFSSIGGTPQDRKYRGEETWLEIGDRNHIREQVTIHRGTTTGGGATRIGDGNLLMVGAHVAHDCRLGNDRRRSSKGIFADRQCCPGFWFRGSHSGGGGGGLDSDSGT